MRRVFATLVMFTYLLIPHTVWAESGSIKINKSLIEDDPDLGDVVRLCFYRIENIGRQMCDYKNTFALQRGNKLATKIICDSINTHSSSAPSEWNVAGAQRPDVLLYRIHCRPPFEIKEEYRSREPARSRSVLQPSQQPLSSAAQQMDPTQVTAFRQELFIKLEAIELQLASLVQAQPTSITDLQTDLKPLADAQNRLEQQIADLEAKVVRRLELLEVAAREAENQREGPPTGPPPACQRIDATYEGVPEILVRVHDTVLRFIEITPPEPTVTIGLDAETAEKFQSIAQQDSVQPLKPSILRSVPAITREIKPFFLEERLINPDLYRQLMGDKDTRRVSFNDAQEFLTRLNAVCAGQARFDLPSEEQFVVAARMIYAPVKQGELKECSRLRSNTVWLGGTPRPSRLLGAYWQLTRSKCEPFAPDAKIKCEEGVYVRKGGSQDSAHALECMPEFRGEASREIPQVNTTFRLVLTQ